MTGAAGRLVVGVTGHRKLEDEARIGSAVDAALDEIERLAAGPDKTVRFVALSPLAEGADRLVARRVLERDGAELEAVLPMDEAAYAADFGEEGSRQEFRRLLSRAASVRRIPPAASRDEAYAAAGRFVVDHCDFLIAIWDGRPGEGPGGTAAIVSYAREAGRPVFLIEPGSEAPFTSWPEIER